MKMLPQLWILCGSILNKREGTDHDPTALLLQCAACVAYHSYSLLSQMIRNPGYSFTKIFMLHEKSLLDRLLPLVTIEPAEGVIEKATGIPPHSELATQMREILQQLTSLVQTQNAQTSTLVATIEKAIDEKMNNSGNVTGSRLREMISQY